MRRTLFLFVACAAAALVTGCANPQFSALDCNGAQCSIDVDVSAGCPGDTNVHPATLEVPPNVVAGILWQIKPASSGYSFDLANGITFPVNPGVFDDKGPVTGGKAFHWRDKNNQANRPETKHTFKYVVTVIKPDGTPCPPLDPFIHNN